jgi:hypothetical protein
MSFPSTSMPRIRISMPRAPSSNHSSLSSDDEEQEFDCGNATGTESTTPDKTVSTSSLWDGLRDKNINFPINTECTL